VGAFFVSSGILYYLYLAGVSVPLLGTSFIETPQISGGRSIVHFIAVAAAYFAIYGVYRAITRVPVRDVESATRYVVVAAKAMPYGTLVTKDSVKIVPWPAKSPLTGGFHHVKDVADRSLIAGVVENEPITESKLVPKALGMGLPPSITPGIRAMSIKVNEIIGVDGHCQDVGGLL
jgi:pilus assembly protein CpaB